MKKIVLAMGAGVAMASSLSAAAAQTNFVDALKESNQSICTQEVRKLASLRKFVVHTKDGTLAEIELPNYDVATLPVDCETGKRLVQ